MNKSYSQSSEEIATYVEKTFKPQDAILTKIIDNSKEIPPIQVGAMDGLHLEVLTRAIGASKVVEIGTLGGYSGTCICRGLKPGGKLYTLEILELNAAIARKNFELAGVSKMVEILVAPAIESLKKLTGPFDMVFIDADKPNYPKYLEWAVQNIRLGGVILADNTFGWGYIDTDKDIPADRQAYVEALREYNILAAKHPQLRTTILPTGEGLTFSVRVK